MADNKKLSASIALGTLLIPLSAFAASVLVKDVPPVESTTSVTSPAVPVATTGVVTQTATAADLQAACGVEGLRLVKAESDLSISSIQQAALDALREICLQEGMPLPGKPVPEPVIQTVVVNAAPSTSVSQSSSDDQSEVEHDEEHEEEREEEHEEHEHEEEGED